MKKFIMTITDEDHTVLNTVEYHIYPKDEEDELLALLESDGDISDAVQLTEEEVFKANNAVGEDPAMETIAFALTAV